MIPFYKLEKLTRIQKLRKIAKYFFFAENRLSLAENKEIRLFSDTEFVFFTDAVEMLAHDTLFSKEAKKIFAEANVIFGKSHINYDAGELQRTLNSIKHLLYTETGKEQADWDFITKDGSLDSNKRKIFEGMQVYLEDIRSPFNVGAMFRTAESFGVEKIILSAFCADPRHKRAERTAMGCIDIIPWERKELFIQHENNLPVSLPSLPVFALETGGTPINTFSFPERGILIAGSEELGVSPRALEAADASLGRVSISVYGVKASLNVSTAFGITLQTWAERLGCR